MNPSLDQMALLHYTHSMEAMERFLDAIHYAGKAMIRTTNGYGFKKALSSEMQLDCLDYFSRHKPQLEEEFFQELSSLVGNTRAKVFCNAIAKDWFSGGKGRSSAPVEAIRQSIRNFLCDIAGPDLSNILIKKDENWVPALFSSQELANLLTINDRMLRRHLYGWSKSHPSLSQASRDEIYYRRGFYLSKLWPEDGQYLEYDFINSYSLAISIPEQFAQLGAPSDALVLASAPCDHFNGRVVFFSPFVPEMEVYQLEVGVMPSESPQKLRYLGEHAGMHEYTLI